VIAGGFLPGPLLGAIRASWERGRARDPASGVPRRPISGTPVDEVPVKKEGFSDERGSKLNRSARGLGTWTGAERGFVNHG